MPRGRPRKQLSIADLQAMINFQRKRRGKLMQDRKKAQAHLDQIDRELASLEGGGANGGFTPTGRVRNSANLPDTIESVMRKQGKPMRVGDIVDGVRKAGYRSSSANFRGIVNQTLIKDNRFTQQERGLYKLK